MKSISKLLILLLAVWFTACSEKGNNEAGSQAPQPVGPTPSLADPGTNAPSWATPQTAPAPAATAPTTTAVGGVYHYTCPNNCAGSGSNTGGNCSTCGAAFVHNAAYHTQTGTDGGSLSPVIQQPTPAASPAQNAQGVYHYSCSNGCAGGSGTAGNCSKCGAVLAHNQAYHQ